MECSVGRCPGGEPLELTVSSMSVVARGSAPPGSELAEEAAPWPLAPQLPLLETTRPNLDTPSQLHWDLKTSRLLPQTWQIYEVRFALTPWIISLYIMRNIFNIHFHPFDPVDWTLLITDLDVLSCWLYSISRC